MFNLREKCFLNLWIFFRYMLCLKYCKWVLITVGVSYYQLPYSISNILSLSSTPLQKQTPQRQTVWISFTLSTADVLTVLTHRITEALDTKSMTWAISLNVSKNNFPSYGISGAFSWLSSLFFFGHVHEVASMVLQIFRSVLTIFLRT